MTTLQHPLDFFLPDSQIASEPPEERRGGRDGVRLMVAHVSAGSIVNDVFTNLGAHLVGGDALVVNTSATIPAAIDAISEDGARLVVHVSSPAPGGLWSVEVRTPLPEGGTSPGPDLAPQTLRLATGVEIHLLARNPSTRRLWIAAITGTDDLYALLGTHGRAIRYVSGPSRPMADYQTVFATHPGSAEMPSAGRPFTSRMVTRLVSAGVSVVPVTLHAGVSSFETHETPGDERFHVPVSSADAINATRRNRGRVIAVGTTVVRAVETVADESGRVHPGSGSTDLVVTPDRGLRATDALLTGWHEPQSSHLSLLEAFTGRELLQRAYDEALAEGYLWHEFGDELLILP